MADCCDSCQRCPSISLTEWFEYLCFTQFAGFQLAQNDPTSLIPCSTSEPCSSIVFNSYVQGGHHPGRLEIIREILRADEMFRNYAGYWPAPTYGCDQWAFKIGFIHGKLRLKNAKVTKLGLETLTLLETVAVATPDLSDDDNDGLWDTVTIRVPVETGVAIDEIAVYFTESDWPRGSDRCDNQIRPIQVAVDGTDWVITWNSTSFVLPKLYTGVNQGCIDPQDPDIYPVEVKVYRKWYDETQAVTVYRKEYCTCGLSETCYTAESARACIIDGDNGVIEVDLSSCNFCSLCAQKVCVNYVSGGCIEDHGELIADFVAALIGRNVCCADNPCMKYQQEDFVGTTTRGALVTPLSDIEKANEFGTRRGAIALFRYLRSRRAMRIVRM